MDPNEKYAFLLFYAIFWSAFLPALSKFGPFGISGLVKGGQAARLNALRFALGLLVLNLLPAAWFFFLFSSDSVVPRGTSASSVLAAVLAALSVFAFVNLGYALFGARPWAERLYTEPELKELEVKGHVEKVRSIHLLALALFYLLLFPVLAAIVNLSGRD